MPAYRPEPSFTHDRPTRIGVLIVNLGTPDAPTPTAVRRYLAEFLSDRRVVEIPAILWRLVLHGVILRVRPAKSAKRYAAIWRNEGSPLLVHSVKQRALLFGYVGQRMKSMDLPADFVQVELGMRYGNPDIPSALYRLREAGCDRILAVPLYPQYAASTTASALDIVYAYATHARRMPALRAIDCFHDDPGYIKALAQTVNDHYVKNGRPEKLVMSFHGIPRRVLDRGDPYHCHCRKTARLLAEELGLRAEQYEVTFQSRFGKAQWLQPYTVEVLKSLARQGIRHVAVLCPGFVSDCLETLEEIGIEGKQTFLAEGGKEFHVIPCLNEHPAWMAALTEIVVRNLQGWLSTPPDAEARAKSLAAAQALGARQ